MQVEVGVVKWKGQWNLLPQQQATDRRSAMEKVEKRSKQRK